MLLKKFINQNDLKNTVKLLGYKKNPFPYIVKSDYFILSSNFEGSPNVLVETGFLGTNIISTNCPTGPREILKNGKFGKLFPVGSEIHLKKIFLKLKKKKIINKKFKNYLIKEYSFNKKISKY